jgi:hypothetical protein
VSPGGAKICSLSHLDFDLDLEVDLDYLARRELSQA